MLSPYAAKILADHHAAQEALMAEYAAEDAAFAAEQQQQQQQQQQPPRTGPTGPRTAEGKSRIRLNAYKHGLTGQFRISSPSEQRQFDIHCEAMLTALAPVGPIEKQHAQHIAEDHWRIHRARIMEASIFAQTDITGDPVLKPGLSPFPEVDETLLDGKTWVAQSKTINNLTLYQHRLERSIIRNTAALQTLQAARRQAFEEELLLAELAESEGETYAAQPNPQHPEFVFSTAEILQALTRKKRLAKARERFAPIKNSKNSQPPVR